MNKAQTISWFAFTSFLGAILLGFRGFGKSLFDIDVLFYVYGAFIVLLRFKFALDDHLYFGVVRFKRWQSMIGFAFGVISWFLIIFSAYSISNLAESYLLLLCALGISTVWVVVISIKEGFYREQVYWLATNSLYMIGSGFLIWERKTPSYSDVHFIDQIVTYKHTPLIVIGLMSVALLWDFTKSKSMDQV